MPYFWLSFCDPDRPKGTQFLGALVAEGDDFIEAVRESHLRGVNPGGEVLSVELPETVEVEAHRLWHLMAAEEARNWKL